MSLTAFILSQVSMAAGFFALGLAVGNVIYTFDLTGRRKRHVCDDSRGHGSDSTHKANSQ